MFEKIANIFSQNVGNLANGVFNNQATNAAAAKQTALQTQFDPLFREAQTQEEFDKAVADFKAAGGDTAKSYVDTYQKNLTGRLEIQQRNALAAKQQDLENQLYSVNTQGL